jgi:Spy/CpxP family protein refolding chaperone
MTIRARMLTMAVLAAGLAGLVVGGCASTAAPRQTAAPAPEASVAAPPAPEDEVSSGLEEYHRYHHGGVVRFIALSLDTLAVAPEQRQAIERVRRDLRVAMEPTRMAEAALLTTLADEVGQSTVDSAKVEGAAGEVAATVPQRREAIATSLNQLHDVLTPPQRATLTDKIEAHLVVWQQQNLDGGPPDRPGGHLGELTADLGLTGEQAANFRTAMASREPHPGFDNERTVSDLRAFADAFRRDTFDARAMALPFDARVVGWGAVHLARVVEAMAPILNDEQRALLQQKLRDHATDAAAGGES